MNRRSFIKKGLLLGLFALVPSTLIESVLPKEKPLLKKPLNRKRLPFTRTGLPKPRWRRLNEGVLPTRTTGRRGN